MAPRPGPGRTDPRCHGHRRRPGGGPNRARPGPGLALPGGGGPALGVGGRTLGESRSGRRPDPDPSPSLRGGGLDQGAGRRFGDAGPQALGHGGMACSGADGPGRRGRRGQGGETRIPCTGTTTPLGERWIASIDRRTSHEPGRCHSLSDTSPQTDRRLFPTPLPRGCRRHFHSGPRSQGPGGDTGLFGGADPRLSSQ